MAHIAIASCYLVDWVWLKPPRGNRHTVLACGARLNTKAQPIQRQPEHLKGYAIRGADPDNQHASGTQEVHEPVKRRFESIDRVLPPSHKRHVELAARNAA
jgi:hypothetical protein